MREKLSFEGVFTRGGPDMPYRHLPFEVPPGTRRIEVSYHFGRDAGQPEGEPHDVVDIGVFDQRGADFLTGGFRGYSGGARRQFFIAPQEATPGYVRGPIAPGTWNLMLTCRINYSERCPYAVHVSLDIDPNMEDASVERMEPEVLRAPRPLARPRSPQDDNARSGEGRWYKGDFHSHTEHSDGLNTIDEYSATAARVGLDFLCITDHNTCSHFEEIAQRPQREVLLVPGEEVTTPWGHANVWGAGGWVDFRCTDDDAMQRVIDSVVARGGLFSPNHPKPSAGYPWLFDRCSGYQVVEAWQGAWRYFNTEGLDFWERRLRAGERVVAVGGSDAHSVPPAVPQQPWTLGNPCTWVYVRGSLDEEGVLDAVRAGHTFISEDPTGPFLEMTATCDGRSYMAGDTIEAAVGSPLTFSLRYRGPEEKKLRLIKDGDVWQEWTADRDDVSVTFESRIDAPAYVRAEAAGFRGRPERGEVVHAMTNPLYLRC